MSSEVTSTQTTEQRGVLESLNALRGLAAIGVVVFHLKGAFVPVATPGGYLAVDLFFVMSGVVLSHAYDSRFRAGMGLVEFMRVRLVRLYPLYLLGLACGVVVTLASMVGRNTAGWDARSLGLALLPALFILPDFGAAPGHDLFPLNIPSWSLFLELLVNVVFAATWRVLTMRRLVVLCASSAVLLPALVAHTGSLDQGWSVDGLGVGMARAMFGFFFGVLAARKLKSRPTVQSTPVVLLLSAAFAVAVMVDPGASNRALWDTVWVVVGFPVLVSVATVTTPGRGLGVVGSFLGVTSYAIYILHSPASAGLRVVSRFLPPPLSGAVQLTVLLFGCWLVDRYFDARARAFVGRLVPGRRQR